MQGFKVLEELELFMPQVKVAMLHPEEICHVFLLTGVFE
jgi:hypothetical protein